jgi:hypothetical protein
VAGIYWGDEIDQATGRDGDVQARPSLAALPQEARPWADHHGVQGS